MRHAIVLSSLLFAAACGTGNQISQTAAHIPPPDITIANHTDLTNVSALPTGVVVHFEFRIVNQAEIPITLRRIDMVSAGGGAVRVESKTRQFNIAIPPHSVQTADFVTSAVLSNPTSPLGHEPILLRATSLFDSAQGSLQKVTQQQVRPEGSD
jgi:hypothetical protein